MIPRIRSRLPVRLARPMVPTRSYASVTQANLAPAVALKTDEDAEAPSTSTSSRPKSVPLPPRQVLNLPTRLPTDVPMTPENVVQQAIYPSFGVIDASSMISICLRRPDSTPRAYNIFRQLLSDYDAGIRPQPEAEIFGRVLEGLVVMSESPESSDDRKWRARIGRLVQRWESYRGIKEAGKGQAALDADGIKVYRGWFMGYVRTGKTPLPLVPYLESGSLRVADLMHGIRQVDTEAAFETLHKVADSHKMLGLEQDIEKLENDVQEQREAAAREITPEVRPVAPTPRQLADTQNHLHKSPVSDGDESLEGDRNAIRFSIGNLRKALQPLNSAAAPIIRQRALEESALQAAVDELQHSHRQLASRGDAAASTLSRDQLQAWMHEWTTALTARLEEDILDLKEKIDAFRAKTGQTPIDDNDDADLRQKITSKEAAARKDELLYLLLSIISPQKLALVTVLEIMRNIGAQGIVDGVKAVRAVMLVGRSVETEYQADTIQSLAGSDSRTWSGVLDANSQKPVSRLVTAAWQRIGKGVQSSDDDQGHNVRPGEVDWNNIWTPAWTQHQIIDVGGFLLNALTKTAKVKRSAVHPKTKETVTEEQPAFAHTYEYVKGRKLGVIRLNPAVAARMSRDRLPAMISPKTLPMLVEPRKWESHDVGAYLTSKTNIMRAKEAVEQLTYLKHAVQEKHLEPILHALDVLSATPWRINRPVFEIMLEVWNTGEAVADIPASEEKATYDFPASKPSLVADARMRSDWQIKQKHALNQQRKDHGTRCKINYTLEVARAFLHDTFYLPHNMDFRGRAYPIPPHLSPVGDDLNRGLLLFAEGKPLGSSGMRWLQIHLANVYGYDKMSFDERARFSEDHIKDILDSADKPLEGSRWWLQAEDPWQCLATCKEIAGALRSPNPEEYISHMPVHQDGTCNGMQHYAALGGDVRGARAVNLEDGDRPADIYTRVVEIVNKVVAEDAKAGVEPAMIITEPLTRKIVKQTVMTTVYGVTFVGARDQIAKQLVNRMDVPQKDLYFVSAYLAKTVLSCIGDLFAGAKDIQDWLTIAARLISRSIAPAPETVASQSIEAEPAPVGSKRQAAAERRREIKETAIPREFMSAVIWTTPLGLPVVQPYRKEHKRQVMTALQTVYVSNPYQATEVSTLKQASAFPPNFIHSLDATHMFMTALGCKRHNISFAAVHDSYWTHASTVEPMSDLIRDAFISLHSQNLIGELRKEFIERCGENLIPVEYAKLITESVRAKNILNRAKRHATRGGDEPASESSNQAEKSVKSEEGSGMSLADASGMKASLAQSTRTALANAELEVLGEEPAAAQADEPITAADLASADESQSFTDDEVATIMKKRRGSAGGRFEFGGIHCEIHVFGGQKYVKFKDVLPPTPPRGEFDVEKTRTSQYFFS